jgi:GT2 family glycosyltransferase
LEEMPLWAADYVRENDNRLFDIPVLAMFCVAMRKEVFEQVGLLDEDFAIGMFEDDDYARRVREAGYKVVCTDDSFIHHFGRAAFKLLSDKEYLEIFQRNRNTYEKKWGPWEPHMDRETRRRSSELLEEVSRAEDETVRGVP